MLSDPRIGLVGSLVAAGLGVLWFIALGLAGDEIWESLGYVQHAITYFAILLTAAGLAVSLLFRAYVRVKADLLAGRDVLARWSVDPKEFAAFGPRADARDHAEKRSALIFILVLLALAFGGFAIFDIEAAPMMLSIGVGVALLVILAYLWSNRIRRKHLTFRTGEVIVGRRGLLVNDVLHVWGVFLSWLSAASLEKGKHPVLTITYGYLARYGPQYINVSVPVPRDCIALATEAARELNGASGGRKARTGRVAGR